MKTTMALALVAVITGLVEGQAHVDIKTGPRHSCHKGHLYCGSRLNDKKYTNREILEGLARKGSHLPDWFSKSDFHHTLFECNNSGKFTFVQVCDECKSTRKGHSDYCLVTRKHPKHYKHHKHPKNSKHHTTHYENEDDDDSDYDDENYDSEEEDEDRAGAFEAVDVAEAANVIEAADVSEEFNATGPANETDPQIGTI